jgi:hypothetical protein
MRVLFHPEFPRDIRRFEAEYARISNGLAKRFRHEAARAVDAIKQSPSGAGHFLNVGSSIVPQLRRRNLQAFPFFVLYGVTEDQLVFGSIIPSRSDPLTWLCRFPGARSE